MSGTYSRKARDYWDEVTLAMPYTFTRAVVDVAHKYRSHRLNISDEL